MVKIIGTNDPEPTTPKSKPRPAQARAQESKKDTPPPAPEKRPHTPDERRLAEALSAGYQAMGGALIMVGMRLDDGGLVGSGSETISRADLIADAWIDLARRNPAVKQWLKKVTEVSAVGMVVGAHIACAIPFLASRGILPPVMVVPDEPPTDPFGNVFGVNGK